ncbi:SDR family NAD(P)-dependent oxidoreductase [Curtobacterium sp. MCPF17_002]|uniref:SDR family NAD(P)-dependent oxidoreductase n=1 Tax=Curtobacterium sp. MCPF17_002 TaxID=2175645 RepID=UPI000DAA3F45|nr:SDR family NAD(P)-dependent oxidoreductase [Curtobacterium sp. MCPF17_002]WIB78700.1 SDR family NAD(P)-dependent oxidoreductase [Curtobacterium sp. MCPF17_002]
MPNNTSKPTKAWVITGPTSGIGREAALQLAEHGTVVLVGRDLGRLREVEREITALPNGNAVSVVADFADVRSARRAADEIGALGLTIGGVANNAGGMQTKGGSSAQGWDIAFATNHLGPFAFTEALLPYLADGTPVLFTVSGVEDPERKPATASGFRGGRYISAEASARGEWKEGGSKNVGFDAYATSKQGNLATVFTLAREVPRLRFMALEPGFNPGTGLSRDASPVMQFVAKRIMQPLAPMIKYWSTPRRAGKLIAEKLTTPSTGTGVYSDENGRPMQASKQVSDPAFSGRYIAETRALLAQVPAEAG